MKRYLGNKQFYKKTLIIALPIMAQQFIATFVNLIDNIMIGSIGGIALTSVTMANRFYLIFNSTLFGIGGAAGIFIAQFYGAKEKEKCQKAFDISLVWAGLMAIVFTAVLFFVPQLVIEVFSKSPEIVSEGVRYLEYAKYTYFPFAVSFTCMMALRAVGINMIQLKVGVVAVIINTALNYCLIFGNFGFPMLGVKGAAIARVVEMCLYLLIMYRNKHFFSLRLHGLLHRDKHLTEGLFKRAVPLTINEVLFSSGQSMVYKSYVRTDEYLVAAVSVVDTVANILFVVFSGLSSAVSILIGNTLGANKIEEAKDNARKLIMFGVIIAVGLGSVSFLMSGYIPNFYNVASDIKDTIVILLRIKSIMIIIYAVNVCIFFVLRAGGDIVSTLIMDSGFLWVGGVFVSTLLSINLGLPLVMLYAIVESLDIIKLFVAFHFFKKEKWAKNITT
ncbi:MAG: MATE family efflux transporter [Coprobacillaceae bacterium]